MRRTLKNTATTAAVVALAGGLSIAPSLAFGYGDSYSGGSSYDGGSRSFGDALDVVGLGGNGTQLVRFSTSNPGSASKYAVSGLSGDSKLVGIDYRPATGFNADGSTDGGDLYGLGNAGGVYVIDRNGAAVKRSTLNVALSGTNFGVDFNPVVDRLRIVSDNGQNLRANVDTGATIVDATLNNGAGVTTTGVSAAAYTNNDADTTSATTLYDLGTAATSDSVFIQSPPNAGVLAATGTTGDDFAADTGFDIYSKVRNGEAVELFPYAVSNGRLFDVTLFNGNADDAGRIGDGSITVTDLAIPLNQL